MRCCTLRERPLGRVAGIKSQGFLEGVTVKFLVKFHRSSMYLHRTMRSTQPYFTLLIFGASFLFSTTSNAQFNEDQVAERYAALRDSLDQADSLLASGDRASALAIYQATTPWKHNISWRYMKHLKCTIGPEQANRATLDSLAKLHYDSMGVSDLLQRRSQVELMVDSLYELDQEVRNQPIDREMALRRDSINIHLLYQAFRNHGGYVPSVGSIFILIHALSLHQEHLDYFAQAITDALMDQEMDSYTYGAIVDEFFWHTKNCQMFGTIGHSDDMPGLKWCDPEQTVRLRKLMGLPETTE